MQAVFIHEDDLGLIELLPLSDWQFCENELKEIQCFAREHADPSGIGWTDIYMRGRPPFDLSGLRITRQSIIDLIGGELVLFDRVMTGYSTYAEPLEGTIAFGLDSGPVIYVLSNEQDLAAATCIEPTARDIKSEEALTRVLLRLGEGNQLLLVDRLRGLLANLSDADSVSSYMGRRLLRDSSAPSSARH